MAFPEHIFKAYDIRGIYPSEVDEELANRIGRAFADFTKSELNKESPKIVVGNDMRLSSPALKAAVIKGITEQGADVVDIGLVSTPTFYFGVSYFKYDAGLQVSASHNPGEYNGFKLVRAHAVPVSGDTGINIIRDWVQNNNFKSANSTGATLVREGVLEEQIDYAIKQVDIKKIKPFSIVVDSANGMGALLMDELFKRLPCKITKMFFELDGNFPNHEADPLKDKNNRALQEKVLETKADLGIALDGDADRIFFIDNKGRTIDPAMIRGILARIFLREYPGATICYDIRPGRITEDLIKESGGNPVITRVGHSLIKEKMNEVGSVFAGESSGHFFLKMPHGSFEAPEIMTLKLLEELSASGKSASEYTAPLYRYYHSGEINFEVEDKGGVFERLKNRYGSNLIYDFDGLSFGWSDWWFNVRPSNTENKVRLNLEAVKEEVMKEKVEEVKKLIV